MDLLPAVPSVVMLILFFWYVRIARRSLAMDRRGSPLQRQVEMLEEAQRTGRLIGTIADDHERRLGTLERRV
jgi:hypothetical protein